MAGELLRRYRSRIVWGPFEEIADPDVDRVEHEIGRKLPQSFRDFLLVAHGGIIPYAVRLPPGDVSGQLIEFNSLTPVGGDWGLARLWTDSATRWLAAGLPYRMLEVARDGGGSALFLDLRQGSFGAVWAYVHGLPDWTGAGRADIVGQVAESWDAYLDMLTIDPDYARQVWEDVRADPDDADWAAAVTEWLDSELFGWRLLPWA